ncbi:putative HTH-type transcriptional regulator YsmB [Lentibacillus sp. JNUCC-1]|uniref:MarR family winged helix-turn-helix transcriptional regulator n=1 Tax=Lentibacillus sp. JNUCC-1 TaxID=2654513 RepID=UPI0013279C0E|nr:putative HTH-type transcriptional regulator YsmB [Lentibacillus sp. JNUCC-1]
MTKPDDQVPIENIEKKLRYIAGAIKLNGRKILNNYPITSPQFAALQWLIDDENLTIGELSKKIGLAFSTTTDLVDRMENNALVKRVRDEKDRRVVRIQVEDKGKVIIKEVIKKRQAYLGEVLASFSMEDSLTLNTMLSDLYEQMKIKQHQENN